MQDGKNLILAIVLCLFVVVGWSWLGEKMGWAPQPQPEQAQQEQQGQAAPAPAPAPPAAIAPPMPTFTESEGRELSIQTPLYSARIYTGGAILRSFKLKKYLASVAPGAAPMDLVSDTTAATAPLGLLVNGQPSWSVGKWACEEEGDEIVLAPGERRTVRFVGMVGELRVVRDITFDASTYLFDETVSVVPLGTQAVSVRLGYTMGMDADIAQGGRLDSMRIGWDDNGSLEEQDSADKLQTSGVIATGRIYWGAAMCNYFMSCVLLQDPGTVTVKGRLENGVYRVALDLPDVTLVPGQETTQGTRYWIGPKERKMLAVGGEELERSVNLGMFSIIAQGLLWLLDFFHGYVGNWGIAIIMLTIVIKALFWPLTAKSYSSMEKMKALAPMMQKIKEKYKDDKETINKETMALYKTYGVNPASGCIPILIQMPVFFGLYQALYTSVELRHAPFIPTLPGTDITWLADLSSSDPLYITPIVMGLSMVIQQRLAPAALDSRQQKMMMLLPVVFTFMFLGFPSGLVVYWLVNNIISIGQQWMMRRKLNVKPKAKKGQDAKAAQAGKSQTPKASDAEAPDGKDGDGGDQAPRAADSGAKAPRKSGRGRGRKNSD